MNRKTTNFGDVIRHKLASDTTLALQVKLEGLLADMEIDYAKSNSDRLEARRYHNYDHAMTLESEGKIIAKYIGRLNQILKEG